MVEREAILKLMDEAGAVILATVDGTSPRIRALSNLRRADLYPSASRFCRSQGLTLYLATSWASAKVREIRANPSTAAYYCDPQKVRGITLSGSIEILSDPELKRTLWEEVWRIYWPGGPEEDDFVVLRMKPTHAEGWWGTEPFEIEAGSL
jgi:general stress protein 26